MHVPALQMNMSIKRFPERLRCMIFQKQFDERMAEIELVCWISTPGIWPCFAVQE
jgi:hypothetical protein